MEPQPATTEQGSPEATHLPLQIAKGATGNLPLAAPTPVRLSRRYSTALEEIDRKFSTAAPADLLKLAAAREKIIQQDERLLKGEAQRSGDKMLFYARTAFSLASIGIGTTLVILGLGLPGFFLIGGSAAVYVPDYVRTYFGRSKQHDLYHGT